MEIIVEDCDNKRPIIHPVSDMCVTAGEQVVFTVRADDPQHNDVVFQVFFEPLNPSPLIERLSIVQSTTDANNPAKIIFRWQPSCEQIRMEPYKFVVKVTNRPKLGVVLSDLMTVAIKVIPPPIEFSEVNVNPVSRTVDLRWHDYECDNLKNIQIWRRTTAFQLAQSDCSQGIPQNSGFEMLGTSEKGLNRFVDSSVEIGAQYCYRLVPIVGDKNIPGKMSLDTCIIPKPIVAPAITNVSVETTATNGKIKIKWISPIELDHIQYPPPYKYQVFRKKSGPDAQLNIISDLLSDTVFVDQNVNSIHPTDEYGILLFVPSLSPHSLDTSALASAVNLTLKPLANKIALTWTAHSPWSNTIQQNPFHLIYRSSNGGDGEFKLIDSVNTATSGYHFTDSGQYHADNLVPEQYYYYKVVTRGSYGNPKILSPLINFSQIAGGETLDVLPPCKPSVLIKDPDCQNFPCAKNDYYNLLEWNNEEGCPTDVIGYKILVDNPENSFDSLAFVPEQIFKHDHLESMERSYMIVAIDDAGNASDTATVTGKNCLSFNVPNVFTPEMVDLKNDVLTLYTAGNSDETSCSRFIKHVTFSIFNRWGEEIFKKVVSPDIDPVFWNGSTGVDEEMPSGVYFYLAQVEFETIDADDKFQTFKGWVHLIR